MLKILQCLLRLCFACISEKNSDRNVWSAITKPPTWKISNECVLILTIVKAKPQLMENFFGISSMIKIHLYGWFAIWKLFYISPIPPTSLFAPPNIGRPYKGTRKTMTVLDFFAKTSSLPLIPVIFIKGNSLTWQVVTWLMWHRACILG